MSSANSRERSIATSKIESVIRDVHESRRRLIEAKQNPREDVGALQLREFTADLFSYYIELRPYQNSPPVEDLWDDIEMWPAQVDRFVNGNGGMVTGVDAIENWMDRHEPITQGRPGLGRGKETKLVPAFMPPKLLINGSQALDSIAKELGFSIELPDEYREPSDVF